MQYLNWYLKPPGYYPDWLLGLWSKKKDCMVGFVVAVPVNVIVEGEKVSAARIASLCIRRTLRKLGMDTYLKVELARRVRSKGIKLSIYASGFQARSFPDPIRSIYSWAKNLNVEDLLYFGWLNDRKDETRRCE